MASEQYVGSWCDNKGGDICCYSSYGNFLLFERGNCHEMFCTTCALLQRHATYGKWISYTTLLNNHWHVSEFITCPQQTQPCCPVSQADQVEMIDCVLASPLILAVHWFFCQGNEKANYTHTSAVCELTHPDPQILQHFPRLRVFWHEVQI